MDKFKNNDEYCLVFKMKPTIAQEKAIIHLAWREGGRILDPKNIKHYNLIIFNNESNQQKHAMLCLNEELDLIPVGDLNTTSYESKQLIELAVDAFKKKYGE